MFHDDKHRPKWRGSTSGVASCHSYLDATSLNAVPAESLEPPPLTTTHFCIPSSCFLCGCTTISLRLFTRDSSSDDVMWCLHTEKWDSSLWKTKITIVISYLASQQNLAVQLLPAAYLGMVGHRITLHYTEISQTNLHHYFAQPWASASIQYHRLSVYAQVVLWVFWTV